MPNFNDHATVLELLKKCQDADYDNRERVRDVINFLEKDDGQWEPEIINRMTGRPRYTFDKCNPIVDAIAGEIEQADFDIRVRPAGGDATKETAKVLDGLIRNIENMSRAGNVYNQAARRMVACGFDAWRVTHEYSTSASFEQDLVIKRIGNAVDRVWFDVGSEEQDRSDSSYAFVLQAIPKSEYDERWPEGSGHSIGEERSSDVYTYKPDHIIVGEILYKKPQAKELVLMSNGSVYDVDEKFEQVKDELAQAGVTEERRRKVKEDVIYSRLFDGDDWLTSERETVFRNWIPVIPVYGNFSISENKVIYRGAVNRLMDAQRVYNYAQSRAVEEGALAPRAKYWMTKEQAAGHQKQLQTMNTNADPVQFYNQVDGQVPPFWQGGAQVNAGLQQTAMDMAQNITEASAIFAANQGNAPMQSGIAIELQQNKGDTATVKYFKAQEYAITHTARILVDAIPRVYDTRRQVRILNEDGSFDMQVINDVIFDQQTGQLVEINDLSKGQYDVVCDVGPAFKNRQQEAVKALVELAQVDPTFMQMGGDVLLNNIASPGIDLVAARIRRQMVSQGLVPDEQMTDEEKQELMQQIQQQMQQGPDPMEQALMEQTQANTADIMSKAEERQNKAMLEAEKLRQKEMELMLKAQEQQRKENTEMMQMMMQNQMQVVDTLKKQAETLKTLREAMGVDAAVGPQVAEAYSDQAKLVQSAQDMSDDDLFRELGAE